MKFGKFTEREKQIYRQGKIAAYYKLKKASKKKEKQRYGSFDVEEAWKKALARTYGDHYELPK